jgi:hypothetical protein
MSATKSSGLVTNLRQNFSPQRKPFLSSLGSKAGLTEMTFFDSLPRFPGSLS